MRSEDRLLLTEINCVLPSGMKVLTVPPPFKLPKYTQVHGVYVTLDIERIATKSIRAGTVLSTLKFYE